MDWSIVREAVGMACNARGLEAGVTYRQQCSSAKVKRSNARTRLYMLSQNTPKSF